MIHILKVNTEAHFRCRGRMGELSVPFVNHFCKTPEPQGSSSAWAGAGSRTPRWSLPWGVGRALKGVSVCFCLIFTICAMCVCAEVVVVQGHWPWHCMCPHGF